MNARKKLNVANLNGSFLAAAIIGWLTESMLVFLVAGAILIASAMHSGNIRLDRDKRRRR